MLVCLPWQHIHVSVGHSNQCHRGQASCFAFALIASRDRSSMTVRRQSWKSDTCAVACPASQSDHTGQNDTCLPLLPSASSSSLFPPLSPFAPVFRLCLNTVFLPLLSSTSLARGITQSYLNRSADLSPTSQTQTPTSTSSEGSVLKPPGTLAEERKASVSTLRLMPSEDAGRVLLGMSMRCSWKVGHHLIRVHW